MKNNLFNAIRLQCERKGLNIELKKLQSQATELNKRANINPMGQIQMPLAELRSVITDSASTKVNGYEITPNDNVKTKARNLEGLQANARYPIFRFKLLE